MNETEKTAEDQLPQAIDRFWETFPPVWNRIIAHVREIATEQYEVTLEQFHILRHIRKGLHSASELAEVKHISRPAVSQALDGLVEKGLVSRQQSAEDRRYVHIDLTPAGSALMEAIFAENRAWMKQKMAWLSPEDMACVLHAMDVLHQTFGEPAGKTGS